MSAMNPTGEPPQLLLHCGGVQRVQQLRLESLQLLFQVLATLGALGAVATLSGQVFLQLQDVSLQLPVLLLGSSIFCSTLVKPARQNRRTETTPTCSKNSQKLGKFYKLLEIVSDEETRQRADHLWPPLDQLFLFGTPCWLCCDGFGESLVSQACLKWT